MTAYVANQGSGTVTPIRTATNTAGKAIKIGDNPQSIAITPNVKTAYLATGPSWSRSPPPRRKLAKAIKGPEWSRDDAEWEDPLRRQETTPVRRWLSGYRLRHRALVGGSSGRRRP